MNLGMINEPGNHTIIESACSEKGLLALVKQSLLFGVILTGKIFNNNPVQH